MTASLSLAGSFLSQCLFQSVDEAEVIVFSPFLLHGALSLNKFQESRFSKKVCRLPDLNRGPLEPVKQISRPPLHCTAQNNASVSEAEERNLVHLSQKEEIFNLRQMKKPSKEDQIIQVTPFMGQMTNGKKLLVVFFGVPSLEFWSYKVKS